jgi:hypothetical protein
MNSIIMDVQALVNHYGTGIKFVRILYRNGLTQTFRQGAGTNPVSGLNMTTYQADFGNFVEKYAEDVQEVQVIFKDGAGASQFFPKGTDERQVWKSIIPKEDLE